MQVYQKLQISSDKPRLPGLSNDIAGFLINLVFRLINLDPLNLDFRFDKPGLSNLIILVYQNPEYRPITVLFCFVFFKPVFLIR